jgi:hypothetical protein
LRIYIISTPRPITGGGGGGGFIHTTLKTKPWVVTSKQKRSFTICPASFPHAFLPPLPLSMLASLIEEISQCKLMVPICIGRFFFCRQDTHDVIPSPFLLYLVLPSDLKQQNPPMDHQGPYPILSMITDSKSPDTSPGAIIYSTQQSAEAQAAP